MLRTRRNVRTRNRRGNIAVIAAFCMPIVIGFVAFAIDWGHIAVARSELQNAADAAALAAGSQMMDDRAELYLYTPDAADDVDMTFYVAARDEAAEFALKNQVRGVPIVIDKQADVEFFYLDPDTKEESTADPAVYNSVRVTTRRSAALNSPLPLFISGFFGFNQVSLSAVAQATFYDAVTKIRTPPKGTKSSILPFAVKVSDWEKVVANGGPVDLDGDGKADINDGMKFDPDAADEDNSGVADGTDDLPELRMYPDAAGKKGNLTPGNFGTVNVGGSSNSASHVADQITNGMSDSDWAYQGGEFDFSEPFQLSGDTGVSAGFKEEMQAIAGQTRTIFLYESVAGNGNNASFKIVGFAGIRVMKAVLTGGTKGIYIQPAPVADPGAVGGVGAPQYNVTSPLTLTR